MSAALRWYHCMHIPNGLIRHNGLFGRTKKPPSKIESQHKFKKRNHRDGYFVCRLETFSMSQSISELVALNFYHIGSADTGQWSVVLGESRKCFQKKKFIYPKWFAVRYLIKIYMQALRHHNKSFVRFIFVKQRKPKSWNFNLFRFLIQMT